MSEEQFKILFDTHFDAIRRYLYYRSGDKVLATDLAQDTFMRIWEKQLDPDPVKDVGLLYKIAGDFFISHARRAQKGAEIISELKVDLSQVSPEEELQYKELKGKYEGALGKMPENQRSVFLMSRMEHLTYQEIAERLSLSIKTIEKRISKALILLRKELKSQ